MFAVACSGTKKETALPAGSKVLALGDSLTAPHGVKPGEDWPTLLGQKTGWVGDQCRHQRQYQRPGARTPAGPARRAPAATGAGQPGRQRHAAQAAAGGDGGQPRRMLDLAKARGAKAVLLATPKPSIAGAVFNNLAAADFYADVAREKKVPLIKDVLPEVLSDTALKSDQLHPNAAGHAQIGEMIYAELKRIGFAR
jgi:acyl-CoA thioesterase-1